MELIMGSFNYSHSYIQKVFTALEYCTNNRSRVNDIFYFSSLRHVDAPLIEAKVIPVEVVEKIIETWINCYRELLEDKHLLNESGLKHLAHWQELLMLPPAGLH
ncbi:hypothetical protein BALOs_2637 [Halobacteriovorax sp. BALOs_7]|nr:hypothetical protein BALOs_2637 [Halobacteriovorax sp. BALOs_7]